MTLNSIKISKISFFFFNDTATTEIYTLSLHDALPISLDLAFSTDNPFDPEQIDVHANRLPVRRREDRKSTRLNSSHLVISYAVFCLKKKKHSLPPSAAEQTRTLPERITLISLTLLLMY